MTSSSPPSERHCLLDLISTPQRLLRLTSHLISFIPFLISSHFVDSKWLARRKRRRRGSGYKRR